MNKRSECDIRIAFVLLLVVFGIIDAWGAGRQMPEDGPIFKEIITQCSKVVTQGLPFEVQYTIVSKEWSQFSLDNMFPFMYIDSKTDYGNEGAYSTATITLELMITRSGSFALPAFSLEADNLIRRPEPYKINVKPNDKIGKEIDKAYECLEKECSHQVMLEVSCSDDFASLFTDNRNGLFALVANRRYWNVLWGSPILAYSIESAFPKGSVKQEDGSLVPLLSQYWEQLGKIS